MVSVSCFNAIFRQCHYSFSRQYICHGERSKEVGKEESLWTGPIDCLYLIKLYFLLTSSVEHFTAFASTDRWKSSTSIVTQNDYVNCVAH